MYPNMDVSLRDRLIALFALFNKHLTIEMEPDKLGEDGTVYSSWRKYKGSKLKITLKLDRPKMLHYDDEQGERTALYFDFATVNNIMKKMMLIPARAQLEFELQMVDDNGDPVSLDRMGTAKKRPESLLSNEDGVPIHKITSEVRRRSADPSPRRLDSIVFSRILISSGVSSRCLHTKHKRFRFRVLPSNVDKNRWAACFPGCDAPCAIGDGFCVYTSRARAMKNVRVNRKLEKQKQSTLVSAV
jgi:hypothetical protein